MRSLPGLALTVLTSMSLTGCMGGPGPDSVTGIPASWLEDTAQGWAGSDAFGGEIPVLTNDSCRLGDVLPSILDDDPEVTDSGWGSYGEDATAVDSYRYLCDFWSEGRYAGSLQLIQAADAATVEQTLQQFVSQNDTPEQDNTVTTVNAGKLEVHVLKRWYPTNPQGLYEAMYVDAGKNAAAVLGVNSLDDSDFAEYSDEQVAEDLLAALASGS